MKSPSTSKFLFVMAALLILAAGSFFVVRLVTERIEIRNLSGQAVTEVVLEIHDLKTDWSVTKHAASLKPGESLRVRHTHRDTKAVIKFVIAGRSFRQEEGYIDLWTGEGCVFAIKPDGTVTSEYDYSEKL
jgi:hypothetical protein